MFDTHKITALLAALLFVSTPGLAMAGDGEDGSQPDKQEKKDSSSTKDDGPDTDGKLEPDEDVVETVDEDGDEEIDAQEALAAGQPLAAASSKAWTIGASLGTRIGQGTFVTLENEGQNDAEFGGESSNAYDRVNMNLGVSFSYAFFDQFIATTNIGMSQWLTAGGGVNDAYETRISDLSFDIFWFGHTFEKTRTNLSVDVGGSFPTSRFSRAATVRFDPFAAFIVRQPLLGKMFFVGSLVVSKTFHRLTSPAADLNSGRIDDANPLFRANGAEDLGDGIVAIAGRNTEYALLPTIGFNFIVLPKMTASVRYRYGRFWSYAIDDIADCENDPKCSLYGKSGRGVSDQVSGSIGVNYQLSKHFFLNGSLSSSQSPKTSDNASFRFPFWNFEGAANNNSAINLGLTFNY